MKTRTLVLASITALGGCGFGSSISQLRPDPSTGLLAAATENSTVGIIPPAAPTTAMEYAQAQAVAAGAASQRELSRECLAYAKRNNLPPNWCLGYGLGLGIYGGPTFLGNPISYLPWDSQTAAGLTVGRQLWPLLNPQPLPIQIINAPSAPNGTTPSPEPSMTPWPAPAPPMTVPISPPAPSSFSPTTSAGGQGAMNCVPPEAERRLVEIRQAMIEQGSQPILQPADRRYFLIGQDAELLKIEVACRSNKKIFDRAKGMRDEIARQRAELTGLETNPDFFTIPETPVAPTPVATVDCDPVLASCPTN